MNWWNRRKHRKAFEHGFNVSLLGVADVDYNPMHLAAFKEGFKMGCEQFWSVAGGYVYTYQTVKDAWQASESQVRACKHRMIPRYRTAQFCEKCGFIDWGKPE